MHSWYLPQKFVATLERVTVVTKRSTTVAPFTPLFTLNGSMPIASFTVLTRKEQLAESPQLTCPYNIMIWWLPLDAYGALGHGVQTKKHH